MANDVKIDSDMATLLIQALADEFDTGTNYLKVYTGAQPADADTAPTGTLLVTITLPTPAFGTASAGAVSKTGVWSGTVVADGTAGYYQLETAGGHIVRGTIGLDTGTFDLEFSDITWNTDGTVTISTFQLTMPEQ